MTAGRRRELHGYNHPLVLGGALDFFCLCEFNRGAFVQNLSLARRSALRIPRQSHIQNLIPLASPPSRHTDSDNHVDGRARKQVRELVTPRVRDLEIIEHVLYLHPFGGAEAEAYGVADLRDQSSKLGREYALHILRLRDVPRVAPPVLGHGDEQVLVEIAAYADR